MKIGLVSPYVYPLPGGVTQHVRFLYENLRLRGHEVRILTSSHGLQRSSEGDVIRLGKGFSMPANGSVGTITLSPRYVSQAHDLLERERFDVLHFHEPFVPFLSLVLLQPEPEREHRHLPRLRRLVAGLRVRGAGRCAGTRTGCTAGSRCRRRRATSSTATSRATTRSSPTAWTSTRFQGAVPLTRWQDGTPEHPVRRPVRAAQGRAGPAQGLPDPAPDRLRLPAAARGRRAAGARGAPLRGHAAPAGRRVPGPRHRTTSGTSCSGPPTSSARRRRGGSRSGSSCSRRWPRARRSSRPTSTATRASSGAAARRCSCRPRTTRSSPWRSAACSGTASWRRPWRRRACVRAEEFSWPRVTAKVDDYYGFVIRRLAATGTLPAHFTAPIPPSPRAATGPG